MFIVFIGIAVAASGSARSNRKKPASYYYQQEYNYTNPYVVKNSANVSPKPTLIKNNTFNSKITPQSRFCRECGTSITQGASFCQNCGNPLIRPEITYSRQIDIIDEESTEEKIIDKSFCPYCGTKTDKDSIYCFHCGTKLA